MGECVPESIRVLLKSIIWSKSQSVESRCARLRHASRIGSSASQRHAVQAGFGHSAVNDEHISNYIQPKYMYRSGDGAADSGSQN